MKIRIIAVLCLCLLIVACSQEQSPKVNARATIVANNYTDAIWEKGVLAGGDQNGFYFLVNKDASNPVKVGDRLIFKKSGPATVIKADTAVQGGFIAVFVIIDKKIDPVGDGFPNDIYIE
ncbi:MAG: hypothetical protein GX642_05060 [Smithella sp.]|nr:hypothetical protein [Smithella sp.]